MAEGYIESSKEKDATQLADTLKQIDSLLQSNNIPETYQKEVLDLRKDVRKLLVDINTSLEMLSNIEKEDILKTDPTFATQKFKIIRTIEDTKVNFEFDVLPKMKKITEELIVETKENPPESLDYEALPPPIRWQ